MCELKEIAERLIMNMILILYIVINNEGRNLRLENQHQIGRRDQRIWHAYNNFYGLYT